MLHIFLGFAIAGSPAHADDAVAWISYEDAQKQKRRAKRRARAKRKAAQRARAQARNSTVVVVSPQSYAQNRPQTKVVIHNHQNHHNDLERIQRQSQRRLAEKRSRMLESSSQRNVTAVPQSALTTEADGVFEPKFRKSLSFGLRGGATTSDLNDGATDAGLGVAIGYRLFEPIGVELSYVNYGERIDLAADSPLQASAQLFLFPWHDINPYVSTGVTVAKVTEAKNETGIESAPDGYGYGPHAGLGVQFGGVDNVAFTVEARYNSFSNIDKEGSLQGLLGVDYYF